MVFSYTSFHSMFPQVQENWTLSFSRSIFYFAVFYHGANSKFLWIPHSTNILFSMKDGRTIFDKIFDAILLTHVPSKFWSKFIVLKMFDPDAAVAVALVLAKCSLEDWIFDQNFDRSTHTRTNIEELSKYWRLVKIYQTNLIRQYFESMNFLTKTSPIHGQKSSQNFWCQFFASIYWQIFWSCYGLL